MATLFLSYCHSDVDLAERIARDLRAAGSNVWFDEWNIRAGNSISRNIERGLDDAEIVAVLFSARSLESTWVEREWRGAIHVEAERRRAVVLPLLADDCKVPLLLRDRLAIDFRRDYQIGLRDLVAAVDVAMASPLAGPQVATETDSLLAPPPFRLRVVKPALQGERPFAQAQVIIGRQPSCDLAFPDETKISRRHADVRFSQGKHWIRDLASKNKTFLIAPGGHKLRELGSDPAALDHGSTIRLATAVELRFTLE
jgi:hypothetical protein